MRIFFSVTIVVLMATLGSNAQDKKDDGKKDVFVRVHDDGKAKTSAGIVVEVQGLKIEFLESKTVKLDLKPSSTQKTKSGGVIHSFNGYKLTLKESAPILETVTFVRGPKIGTITMTVPKGKILVEEKKEEKK